jgi:hypothetical protein
MDCGKECMDRCIHQRLLGGKSVKQGQESQGNQCQQHKRQYHLGSKHIVDGFSPPLIKPAPL